MPVDVSEVRVEFSNGVKREEYGPTKQAKVALTAIVSTGEDAKATLDTLAAMAQAKVKEMLMATAAQVDAAIAIATAPAEVQRAAVAAVDAPKIAAAIAAEEAKATLANRANPPIIAPSATAEEAPKKRGPGRPPKVREPEPPAPEIVEVAPSADPVDEVVTTETGELSPSGSSTGSSAAADEWGTAGAPPPPVSDAELLQATSAAAQRIGNRQPIIALIASFSTKGPTEPFKVQEIGQPQRRLYLEKLASLT